MSRTILVASVLFGAACAATPPIVVDSPPTASPDTGGDAATISWDAPDVAPGASGEVGGGEPSDAGALPTGNAVPSSSLELAIADEPPYALGARRRAKIGVAASAGEDDVATWNRGGPNAASSAITKAPHPAPRVKVDVVQVRGHILEADVLRIARSKGYWPFRLCFEAGLRRTPKLHGTIRFRVTVGAGGSIRGVRKIAAEIEDAVVVSCVLDAARKITLSSPERGTPDVTLEVSLRPGDAPVAGVSPPPPPTARVPDDLVASLRTRWDDVRACYASGLRRTPDLWGRLALKLRIAVSGRILEASEVESHFPDQDVAECILEVYERAGLSPSSEDRVIVYPLRLGTRTRAP